MNRSTGKKRSDTKLYETAVHEAGHAVMARFFRIGPFYVSINPETKTGKYFIWWGITKFFRHIKAHNWNARQKIEKKICCFVAGMVAEEFISSEPDKILFSCQEDIKDCKLLLSLIQSDIEFGELLPYIRTTRQILSQPHQWGAVLELADALMERKSLESKEAREIIENCTRVESPPNGIWSLPVP